MRSSRPPDNSTTAIPYHVITDRVSLLVEHLWFCFGRFVRLGARAVRNDRRAPRPPRLNAKALPAASSTGFPWEWAA